MAGCAKCRTAIAQHNSWRCWSGGAGGGTAGCGEEEADPIEERLRELQRKIAEQVPRVSVCVRVTNDHLHEASPSVAAQEQCVIG